MQNFLEHFWKVHGAQEAVVPGEALSDEYQQMSDAKLSAGLEKFFGEKCKAKKLEDIDMKGKLEEIGLLPFFHVDVWPAAAAVRELATQMKTRTGFINAELRKCVVVVVGWIVFWLFVWLARFLPNCCGMHVAVVIELDDGGNEVLVTKDGARSKCKLSLATWLIGWDCLALALAMLKLLDFGIAMRYKQVRCIVFTFAWLGVCWFQNHGR